LRIIEPSADLALALAIASSARDKPLRPGVIALGEVGLAGEIRQVTRIADRLTEAQRLGFTDALVPAAYDGADCGLRLCRVRDLREALMRTGITNSHVRTTSGRTAT
jgi:DNA repair protein RadA/Sms